MKKHSAQKTEDTSTHVEIGDGSVYEQLGHKDYREMETKAVLVMEISKTIKKKS